MFSLGAKIRWKIHHQNWKMLQNFRIQSICWDFFFGLSRNKPKQKKTDISNMSCNNNNTTEPICVPLTDGTCVGVRLPTTTTSIDAAAPLDTTTPPAPQQQPPLLRPLLAEFLGTLLLVWVVVGSGIMGQTLSPDNVGVQLMINSLATVGGLYNIILVLGSVSGCHINPIVTLIDVVRGALPWTTGLAYASVQIPGGILGAVVANVTFAYEGGYIAEKERFGGHLWLSEVLATALLILVIHGNVRRGQEEKIPGAVAQLVGAGYFFTSSTIFANPAVTMGRMFSNSFAGIAPRSAGPYVGFQIVGALLGYGLVLVLFPEEDPSAKKNGTKSDCQQLRQVAFLDMNDHMAAMAKKNEDEINL